MGGRGCGFGGERGRGVGGWGGMVRRGGAGEVIILFHFDAELLV